MPSTPNPPDNKTIEVLTLLAVGEIEPQTACETLNTSLDDLMALLEESPELMAQAEAQAKALRADPNRTIARSESALAGAVEALASRIENSGHSMATSELVAASSLLEKLVGVAEARKAELKAGVSGQDETPPAPLLIHDNRPCPKTGSARFGLFTITPEDPRWVDTRKPEFSRKGGYDWLGTYAPLLPDGSIANLSDLVGPTLRFMDEEGRVHGGGL